MSGKVVSLSEVKKESGENVVSILEELLDSAKRGEVVNCLIVTVNSYDTCSRVWANGYRPFTLVGQLENAKYNFIKANLG